MSSLTSRPNAKRLWLVRMPAGSAPIVSLEEPPNTGTFLVFSQVGNAQRAELVSRLERWECVTVPYAVGKTRMVYLRNIRYKSNGGAELLLCFCAECGWQCHCDTSSLLEKRLMACPLCKAKPSPCKCPVFHAFGRCVACSDEALDDCPFPAREPGSSVQVASHVPAA